jgi:hypothetical protein
MGLLLLASCESAVVRPTLPADQLHLVVEDDIAPLLVAGLTESLGAPVIYLGRSETPLRVTQVPVLDSDLVHSAALLVVVRSTMATAPPHDPLATLQTTTRVDSALQPSEAAGGGWSTWEDVFLPEQTLVQVRLSPTASVAQAGLLGQAIRASLERSQVRHRSRQLRAEPGARLLPRAATRGCFEVLVPAGYAWSDTASGWPHSVQIAAPRPTRVVTVFWLEDASESWLQSREFLVGMLRDAMWRLQRDRLEENSIEWQSTPDGSPALIAVWQNPDRIAGGPLFSRFVYDRTRARLYGVQALVFLPGADKHRALQETIAVASTFEIVETP